MLINTTVQNDGQMKITFGNEMGTVSTVATAEHTARAFALLLQGRQEFDTPFTITDGDHPQIYVATDDFSVSVGILLQGEWREKAANCLAHAVAVLTDTDTTEGK